MDRPPLYNPYDKFTGNDFNSFVDGIRAKVANALNPKPAIHSPPPRRKTNLPVFRPIELGSEVTQSPEEPEVVEDDEVEEDFAHHAYRTLMELREEMFWARCGVLVDEENGGTASSASVASASALSRSNSQYAEATVTA